MGKLDVENILDENQHAELVALTNRWAATPPGERPWIVELIRGNLWTWLKRPNGNDPTYAIDEFVENLKSTDTFVTQNASKGVGDRIEKLAMKTDGGLSRAAFHIAFVDSLPEIKEIVNILDPAVPPAKPDWPEPATEEMEEWVTIYGLDWLPFSRWREFEREHGWTGDFVERVASRKFGTFGEIVAVQQEKGQIFFYVYRDLDPMQVGINDQTEIFYKAPPILGSN